MRRWVGFACAVAVAVSPLVARGDVEPIVVCAHASITGTSPLSRSPQRLGQVYFDAINAERGGIDGRPVRFVVFDDQSNPTGARAALERCRAEDPVMFIGLGERRAVSSARRWADGHNVPYLSTVHADGWQAAESGCCASLSVSDEMMMRELWTALSDDEGVNGIPPTAGIVSVNGVEYEAGRQAFADAAGEALVVDRTAQADERGFSDIWSELRSKDVEVVNAFFTPSMLLSFLPQRPAGYDPQIVAPGLSWGRDVIARSSYDIQLLVLSDAAPAWRSPWNEGPETAWDDAITDQHRIFQTYSEEQNPGIDDSDWIAYIRAQQIARILDSLDGVFDATSVRHALGSYSEDAATASPSCALALSHAGGGADSFQALQMAGGWLTQSATCDLDVSLDLLPPTITCRARLLSDELTCDVADNGSGLEMLEVVSNIGAQPPIDEAVSLGCEASATRSFTMPPGVRLVRATVTDCVGRAAAISNVVSVTAPGAFP